MRYAEFVGLVESRAAGGLSQDRAVGATGAVLSTLAGCLPPDVRHNLAAQLPKQLQRALRPPLAEPAPESTPRFLDRVAEREGLSRSEAFDHARAVLDALSIAVSAREIEHVRAHLPKDLDQLFGPPAAANWPQGRAGHLRL